MLQEIGFQLLIIWKVIDLPIYVVYKDTRLIIRLMDFWNTPQYFNYTFPLCYNPFS